MRSCFKNERPAEGDCAEIPSQKVPLQPLAHTHSPDGHDPCSEHSTPSRTHGAMELTFAPWHVTLVSCVRILLSTPDDRPAVMTPFRVAIVDAVEELCV